MPGSCRPVCWFIFLCFTLGSCGKHESADLIFSGGTIYTAETEHPLVEAVAVRDGVIVFAGSTSEALKYAADSTRMIDLHGLTMLPGLIESHGHFTELGYSKTTLNLAGTRTFDDVVAMVRDAAQKARPGEWILGVGWHQDKWEDKPSDWVNGLPDHRALSQVSPDNPVLLSHASGHAVLANAKAMGLAGVNKASVAEMNAMPGGSIITFRDGSPTGIFMENAMNIVVQHAPDAYTPGNIREYIRLATRECQENGITSFDDAGTSGDVIDAYMELKEQGMLGVRMYAMLNGSNPVLLNQWFQHGRLIDTADHMLTVRAIKLYADGALGNRGAWLLEPYSDSPGNTGIPVTPMTQIREVSMQAVRHGYQVCTHAIGDRANREVLDQYEAVFKVYPQQAGDVRFRIEHAQHLSLGDIPRFAQLGVIASMQAIHLSSDMPWAVDRLGGKRIEEGAYVWQKLLRSGAKIVNGTDVPVEPVNPIACFYAAVTRKTLDGKPEGGYQPDQRMTREQALRSYTLDAAYATFEEDVKGSIAGGKLADFTILDKDIMSIPEDEILSTHVMMTILGGRIVYERP